MNAKGAIKILTDYIGTGPEAEPVDFDTAIALGAEALKAWKLMRENPGMSFDTLLPGETEE